MRHATAVDIVRSLTNTPHLTVRDLTATAHLSDILDAVTDAISAGFVTGGAHAAYPEKLALTDGITYCQTCVDGCTCEAGGTGSCGHRGCWGPAATNDCAGIAVARYFDTHHVNLYATG